MKYPSYKHALAWLLKNDSRWLNPEDGDVILSMAAAMIADLFDVADEKLVADLQAEAVKQQQEANRG